MTSFPLIRLRRLRQHPLVRDLVRETEVDVNDLIFPLFIKGIDGGKTSIEAMPGIYQLSINALEEEVEELLDLGIKAVILFGIPPYKDAEGTNACHDDGIIQQAIRKIRSLTSEILIISDVCLCEYTDHGHCGVLTKKVGRFDVDNDKTLTLLAKQVVSHAEAGADVLAPSGMIDGMVLTIRQALDGAGFHHLPILSYSVKYRSSFYGPFRQAVEGTPVFGDRSTHQMDCANAKEALREVALDVQEGADMLMVKPAHAYLDVIYRIKQAYPHVPLGAYHTSGEYSMIKAASERGWLDEKEAIREILLGIRRAGADFIITYFAKELAMASKTGKFGLR